MAITRREVMVGGAAAVGAAMVGCEGTRSGEGRGVVGEVRAIDRRTVVSRNDPVVRKIEPYSALSVGNGRFCFTGDVTGLQTFPERYETDFPLCTMATWAWHTTPHGPEIDPGAYRFKEYDVYGRKVGYATSSTGQVALFNWLRENPHRMYLGRVGLVLTKKDGSSGGAGDVSSILQRLDLWSGVNESVFVFEGERVRVRTCVHPEVDALAVRVESGLVKSGGVKVMIAFAYPTSKVGMADWNSPEKHETTCTMGEGAARIGRKVDEDRYLVNVAWEAGKMEQTGKHTFLLRGDGESLGFVVMFSGEEVRGEMPGVEDCFRASAGQWEKFWMSGGAVDFSASTAGGAKELERRVVLSQYNTALHCAGDMPPSETGLLFNSWYGKSHLEMHWWHGVHFAGWGRIGLLERSLGFYERTMGVARATAERQGYKGVRWQKMVGPEGRDSPSPVGCLLIWQQPHPIYYAELCYRERPGKETLERWKGIVFETAEFMASYAVEVEGRFVLGPPMKTVSENADTLATKNPTFELAYWRFGLTTALEWRKRLGMGVEAKWAEVLERLSKLPVMEGRYLMQEGMTDTYTKWNWEHPALVGALGMQPGVGVDVGTMRETLKGVMGVWQWDRAWGWDFGMTAMTGARVGEMGKAFEALMIESPKNHYHLNGHVYQRPGLTAYLPANGALLGAIAVMAKNSGAGDGGWVRAEGGWAMRHEGLRGVL